MLLQDFKLLQAVALYTAIARFQALTLGQLLNGQCDPSAKKFTHPWSIVINRQFHIDSM